MLKLKHLLKMLLPLGSAGLLLAGTAHAHEAAGHATMPHMVAPAQSAGQAEFGTAGDPAKVTRVVQVAMSDAMRFAPDFITVARGETVRIVLSNTGKLGHEMVLGTAEELQQHAAMMRKFPAMEHAAAHMAHVAPGATAEIVWHFSRAGTFDFACLIPGHSEAGMRGQVAVRPAASGSASAQIDNPTQE